MRKLFLKFITLSLTYILISSNHIHAQLIAADLVIFSYDRPLQLYALLESIDTYVTGLETVTVIYRASDQHYTNAYQQVHANFPTVFFTKQGITPKEDFKRLTLDAVFESPTKYILFAVDDNIFTGPVDMAECIQIVEQTNAYGFFLRLGTHLTHCYSQNCKQPVPPMIELNDTFCAWQFDQGTQDWGYPHTVDCTIYRKADIADDIRTLNYNTPNTFEGTWAGRTYRIRSRLGLCYKHTKVINIPLNMVQNDLNNRNMNSFSPAELLTIFNDGFKMDINPLYQINNISAHIEYEPTFIQCE